MERTKVAVLFDFDGTLGDTEGPATSVSYCLLAPYFPSASAGKTLPDNESHQHHITKWAGKAFEIVLEEVENARREAELPSIAFVRNSASENAEVMKVVDRMRMSLGLESLQDVRTKSPSGLLPSILEQKRTETLVALSKVARPCRGVPEMLRSLKSKAHNIAFCIATTSSKPRVLASLTCCGLTEYFDTGVEHGTEKYQVHSGESDFSPPRFKPDPSVYLKAALWEGRLPSNCVAVEDSPSGVGSAANARIGLIVGYVGANHIVDMEQHAKSLLSGDRSWDGRGAAIVISDIRDLPDLVTLWKKNRPGFLHDVQARRQPDFLSRCSGKYWLPKHEEEPPTKKLNTNS